MPGRYRNNSWLDEFKNPTKYVGSFVLTIPIEGRLLEGMVRPSEDGYFYSVVLNNSFFGHLRKDQEGWKDLEDKSTEMISAIGKLIDDHNSKKTN